VNARVDPLEGDRRSSGPTEPSADVRSPWRTAAVPSEHGGWGLTLEPVLLGLIAAWSWPGLLLGVIALLAFVARTPLKIVLVDRHRHRSLERTRLAARVLAVEIAVIAVLIAIVAASVPAATWVPLLVAAPLIAIELWFESRSHGRRLAPELTGAIGIGSVAAAIVIAGGGDAQLAAGAWAIVAARAIASIPFVRVLIQRRHGHEVRSWRSDLAQLVALALVGVVWKLGWVPPVAVGAIVALVVAQLVGVRRDPPEVKTIGIAQTGLGVAIAVLSGAGLAAM